MVLAHLKGIGKVLSVPKALSTCLPIHAKVFVKRRKGGTTDKEFWEQHVDVLNCEEPLELWCNDCEKTYLIRCSPITFTSYIPENYWKPYNT